jgi:amino acid adenylation domain-containing protein
VKRLLQDWLPAQAERRPDAIAVVLRDQRMSYAELEQRTNQLARALKDAGCRKGDRVAFAIPKSPAGIVAMLGILKADCIHVPIDTASPAARVDKILKSSQPRCLLGTSVTAALLAELLRLHDSNSTAIGWMDAASAPGDLNPRFSWNDLASYSAAPLTYESSPEDPAHILYTSGSTGDPKGVPITHANVLHFVEWATRYFNMNSSDRISCHPPLHFDLATFDVFGALAVGAELHLVPSDLSPLPNVVAEFIRKSELTQWFSVPSVLNYMAKFDVVKFNDFPSLKRLLWCGEVFPTPALIYWMKRLPTVTFTNLYGPTETTIASSYYTIPFCPADETSSIPIGTACDGEEFLILDDELHALAKGATGDLYIRGVGLSPGYWGDPEKTAQAFLAYGPDGRDRIYRTGDRARIGDDGLVYFMGRSDSQIKSRGYRIELGEVESALNTFDELQECAVVAIPTDGFEGTLICSAYATRNKEVTTAAIRGKLNRLLPSYMLPARWLSLDTLPKNRNGKIDRRALRDLFAEQLAAETAHSPATVSTGTAHPAGTREEDSKPASLESGQKPKQKLWA